MDLGGGVVKQGGLRIGLGKDIRWFTSPWMMRDEESGQDYDVINLAATEWGPNIGGGFRNFGGGKGVSDWQAAN